MAILHPLQALLSSAYFPIFTLKSDKEIFQMAMPHTKVICTLKITALSLKTCLGFVITLNNKDSSLSFATLNILHMGLPSILSRPPYVLTYNGCPGEREAFVEINLYGNSVDNLEAKESLLF